ncbi:olfactory receptor 4D1-like [Terrapene carolina triunguis]|uniref:olfactory receptor 4D1-like n=1 Tax=Terrapene triunguis TaxID=2587831 RepID=UPI00115628A7|nr:olfactory receptor 4D1-like [Terrapene carolina triunguis]
MEEQNLTAPVTEFVLLGLTQNPGLQRFLFVVFLIVYVNTWLGNFIIITTVITNHRLHTPMYNLNLTFLDVSESSGNAPNMQLQFCGPNVLDNFYCDVSQVIKLACVDTHMAKLQMVFNGGVLLIIVLIVLLISYTIILVKIRTHITRGKCKALSK